uniref:Ribosomal protein 3/homing endonuclease-like fusion protein n=1 Tax=Ophiostoma minus TaxID=150568 RepID=C7SWG4_9PEZI|nr:ribosomal protein 3/homing endonuclease-like fusion protein [Ophiostoma minus]
MENNIKLKNSLNKNKSTIFNKYINNKYKLVPFKTMINYVNEPRYIPSEFKEWNNSIYYFNFTNIKNLPVYDINLNKLLKSYFDLYFFSASQPSSLVRERRAKDKKNKFISIIKKKNRFSLNKIFISKADLKHTSSKIIITIYIFNRERIILIKNLIYLYSLHFKTKSYLVAGGGENKDILFYQSFKEKLNNKYEIFNKIKLNFNLNNLKFKDIMLYKLSKLLSKFYKKKVKFNIINLNSYKYNSDIVTDILKKKIGKPNSKLLKIMKFIAKKSLKASIGKTADKYKDKTRISKSINYDLIPNKYKNLNISVIIKNINFNETIKNIYNIKNNTNENIIYNSIKYKLVGGVRLEIKGRLTRRYRADRSKFYTKTVGTLQNIDSSFKGLSSKLYRGKFNSNMQYSIDVYKRHVGSYAVKGWISGRSYSTSAYIPRNESINPWVITGFADAEGSFLLRIRNNKNSVGYSTELGFQITLHNKDKSILENIQSTWKVGVIANSGANAVSLKVTRFEDLKVIINHFEKYPLITQKLGDYMLFKQAFSVMENKEHLKIEGIKELVGIKAKLNWGLTDELKKAFPENISEERSLINKNIPNFEWLAGFTSGEGLLI